MPIAAKAIKVTDCGGCPMCHPRTGIIDSDAFECTHPEGRPGYEVDRNYIPAWCPLVESPFIVLLHEDVLEPCHDDIE